MSKKVAVIGAGAAGLCSLRHLLADPENFTAVAFERNPDVGGVWLYCDTPYSNNGNKYMPTSIYKNLITNLPKEVTNYHDFPFNEDLPTFVHHTDVLKYLQSYCQHFNLRDHIKFKTEVLHIEPAIYEDDIRWRVTVNDMTSDTTVTQIFDAVMVCNGHYQCPYIPDTPGSGRFQGTLIHSKEYKEPDRFKGQVVVILGLSFSGLDIMLEVATVAKQIFAAHCGPRQKNHIPDNVKEMPGIREILPNGVLFENDEFHKADSIIYCTGFQFDFPFLSASCNLHVTDGRITPLYKHMYHIEYPTLCFIGILSHVYPFMLSNLQAMEFCRVLRGELNLPSKTEMLQDEEADFQRRIVATGVKRKRTHYLAVDDFFNYAKYLEGRCDVGNIFTKGMKKLFFYLFELYKYELTTFRSYTVLLHEDSFEVEKPAEKI